MKLFLAAFVLSLSLSGFAKDMSRSEGREAYRTLRDGSSVYVGGCSVHQDYEKKKFKIARTLVPYFEPEYEASRKEILKKLNGKIELQLIEAAEKIIAIDGIQNVDDFTAEKLEHFSARGLDLYRLNIGVGGGNGMYLVFLRKIISGRPAYVLMANIFDGDLEFCDSLVWKK